MTSEALEALRDRLRDIDRDLLRALAARARFPRHPFPAWPGTETRLPPPPLAEILLAAAPAGTAQDSPPLAAANQRLIDGLLARQHLARQIADAKLDLVRADARDALDARDRDQLIALLTDLPAELRGLDFIRAEASRAAPELPPDLAAFLWREYVIPWTRQSEAAHLSEP